MITCWLARRMNRATRLPLEKSRKDPIMGIKETSLSENYIIVNLRITITHNNKTKSIKI